MIVATLTSAPSSEAGASDDDRARRATSVPKDSSGLSIDEILFHFPEEIEPMRIDLATVGLERIYDYTARLSAAEAKLLKLEPLVFDFMIERKKEKLEWKSLYYRAKREKWSNEKIESIERKKDEKEIEFLKAEGLYDRLKRNLNVIEGFRVEALSAAKSLRPFG